MGLLGVCAPTRRVRLRRVRQQSTAPAWDSGIGYRSDAVSAIASPAVEAPSPERHHITATQRRSRSHRPLWHEPVTGFGVYRVASAHDRDAALTRVTALGLRRPTPVLDTVFVPHDMNRPAVEAEREQLEWQIENLTAAVKTGGDIPPLVTELKRTNAAVVDVRRRLEPREQHDREQLRLALSQRVDERKGILRANPAQGRQVLSHLLGPITITEEIGAMLTMEPMAGYDPNDRRGKEDVRLSEVRDTLAEIRWSAETKPAGLLPGLRLVLQGIASPICASWNRLCLWFGAVVDGLR